MVRRLPVIARGLSPEAIQRAISEMLILDRHGRESGLAMTVKHLNGQHEIG